MVQMENEYGSYGNVMANPLDKQVSTRWSAGFVPSLISCRAQYMEHLVTVARKYLGQNVILYTTDGGDVGYMSRGTLNGSAVLTLGDFGPGSDPMTSFNAQNEFNPPGLSPPMCTEYYTGWLTHWGEQMANTSTSEVATWLRNILAVNGSVSMYMGHGGSNFGFWSGANGGGASYQPHITSYDYDAPISEGGGDGYGPDGNKYTAVREVYTAYRAAAGLPSPCPSPPAAPAVTAYTSVSLTQAVAFMAPYALSAITTSSKLVSGDGVSMESLGQNYGFLLYNTTIPSGPATSFTLSFARDRVKVFLNGALKTTVLRGDAAYTYSGLRAGDAVQFLVENMGRLNYGGQMTDPKGILPGDLTWGGNSSAIQLTASTIPLEVRCHYSLACAALRSLLPVLSL